MNAPQTPAPATERLEFLPLHKWALGVAVGVTLALLVFGITAATLILRPQPALPLELLAQYFAGYRVTWLGALIGAAWGGFTGFFMGWFLAFTRNAVVAISIIYLRSRDELARTRSFLDHI